MESNTKNSVVREQCIDAWCKSIYSNFWREDGQNENAIRRFAMLHFRLANNFADGLSADDGLTFVECLDAFVAYVKKQRKIDYWHSVVQDE